ncbi:nucleotide exchange factor GrpE [Patescibacteria group bacterium]|nr:nucleotide exchange factor GrpE [Patescibacteria group bacterium]
MLKNFSNNSLKNQEMSEDIKNKSNSPTSSPDDSELEDLVELKKQVQDYLFGWRRAQADYANLKKETEHQQVVLAKFANSQLILEILPVLDYFKQALKTVPKEQSTESWLQGIVHIQSKLWQVLAGHGLVEIESVGKKFDPYYHEAVQEVAETTKESGLVVEEVKAGYLLHDKVLQPAQVKVAK